MEWFFKLLALFAVAYFGFFSSVSTAEQDMLLRSLQHWYIFSSLCKTVLSYRWVWIVTKQQHTATTSASPMHLFSSLKIKKSDGQWMQTLWKGLVHIHKSDWPVQCHCHDIMCSLKIGRNSSLADEKMMPALPWSVCGVAAFSIFLFLFLSCSAINSGECCCLSYFMCHWLPQSVVKNVHRV